MRQNLLALLVGILFSVGLCHSDMVNPKVVIGFLDILGNWDARLAFVMIGGLLVSFITFPIILKKKKPYFTNKFFLPQNNTIDAKLIYGSILFGIGWGIAGICPGPAISALAFGLKESYIFAIAMLAGMYLYQLSE